MQTGVQECPEVFLYIDAWIHVYIYKYVYLMTITFEHTFHEHYGYQCPDPHDKTEGLAPSATRWVTRSGSRLWLAGRHRQAWSGWCWRERVGLPGSWLADQSFQDLPDGSANWRFRGKPTSSKETTSAGDHGPPRGCAAVIHGNQTHLYPTDSRVAFVSKIKQSRMRWRSSA